MLYVGGGVAVPERALVVKWFSGRIFFGRSGLLRDLTTNVVIPLELLVHFSWLSSCVRGSRSCVRVRLQAFFWPGTVCARPDCTPSHPFVDPPPIRAGGSGIEPEHVKYSFATVLEPPPVLIRVTCSLSGGHAASNSHLRLGWRARGLAPREE